METELTKLNDSDNLNDLRAYVCALGIEFISSELPKIIWRKDGASILQTLFNGLVGDSSSLEKKIKVCDVIFHEIEKKQLPAKIAEKLMMVLAAEVDSFPTAHLLKLADVCCDMIRNPSDSKFSCWKDLLPKILNSLILRQNVDHGGSQMTGEEYKKGVITSLCMLEWSSAIVVDLAAMFIDIPLGKDERARVVKKLCTMLSKLPLDEIPPLVHQLMLLTKTEHGVIFFLALACFFKTNLYDNIATNSLSTISVSRSTTNASNIEGTVLYHIVHNHGPQGLKELLKTFKICQNVPQFVLQPFYVTLLLALSSVSEEEDVLAILRSCLTRAFNEHGRICESAWLRSVLPPPIDVNELFNRVLENCFRSRDNFIKGIISLGFNLLAAGRGNEHLHKLGIRIIQDLVKRNKLVTGIVLETLQNLFEQGTDSPQYSECLVILARKQPLSVTECTEPVIQLLESCNQIPTKTSTQILVALLPLARLSHTIRDNLVVFLRKSLSPRDVDRRILGVTGFLELLRDLKISNMQNLSQSMSQNFCNISQLCSQSLTGGASLTNEGLCFEILSILSAVLKQEHQVKTVLYKGIYSAVRANPELGPHSLDCLLTQLWNWFEPDESLLPLRFHEAVIIENGVCVIQEPLGDLILCLALMSAKLEDSTRFQKMMTNLTAICSRMSSATIQNFNLEMSDGSSILDQTPEAAQKQEIIRQILGVYEALLGFLLCTWSKTETEKSEMFLNIFKNFMLVSDYARGLGKSEKKKNEKRQKVGEKANAFKFPDTVLNFKCCARLLSLINNMKSSWASEESAAPLTGKRELHRYATQVAVQVLREASKQSPTELARDCHSLGYLCNIGRSLYKSYVSRLNDAKSFDLPATLTGLQAFTDLLNLILSHFKPKLANFLNEIAGQALSSQDTIALHSVLNTLLDQLDNVLTDETEEEDAKEDQQAKKVPMLYLATVSCLVQELPTAAEFAAQAYEKVETICRGRKIEQPLEAKLILNLLFILHRRYKESNSLLFDIALTLCTEMNLIDDEMELEEHTGYKIVNRRTANVCLAALCDALQLQFADIDWAINRFKAEAITLDYPSDTPIDHRKEELRTREIDLCRQVKKSSRVLSALCTIAVPTGVYSDAVLKCLETIYNRLSALTKYFTMRVTKFNENLQTTKFDSTVRVIDSELTKNMYCFTEHVIADGITDSRRGNPSLLKQRALKETKHIPKVVLEKEQYHKCLLQLSKRAKMDLATKTKHALARDYRLYTRHVKELIETERIEPQSDSMETEVEENTPPSSPIASKRKRSMVLDDASQPTD